MSLGLRPRGILSLLGTLYPIEHSRSLSNPYLSRLQQYPIQQNYSDVKCLINLSVAANFETHLGAPADLFVF